MNILNDRSSDKTLFHREHTKYVSGLTWRSNLVYTKNQCTVQIVFQFNYDVLANQRYKSISIFYFLSSTFKAIDIGWPWMQDCLSLPYVSWKDIFGLYNKSIRYLDSQHHTKLTQYFSSIHETTNICDLLTEIVIYANSFICLCRKIQLCLQHLGYITFSIIVLIVMFTFSIRDQKVFS